MSTSLPPESGIPPSGEHHPPFTGTHRLLTMKMVTIDCICRARDGLGRDHVRDIDWQYVYDQLTRAQEQVVNAVLLVANSALDDDEDLPDTTIVPIAGHASTDPADSPDVVTEGGDA